MKFAFIDAEKACFPVDVLCDVLGVSRSGYYAWKTRPRAARGADDAQLAVEIAAAHERSRGTLRQPARAPRAARQGRARRQEARRAPDAREGHRRAAETPLPRARPTRTTPTRSRRTCSSADFDAEAPNKAWVDRRDVHLRPARAGSTSPRSSTCSRAASSAGRRARPTTARSRSTRSTRALRSRTPGAGPRASLRPRQPLRQRTTTARARRAAASSRA